MRRAFMLVVLLGVAAFLGLIFAAISGKSVRKEDANEYGV